MVKKNSSQNHHARKENDSRRMQYTQGNLEKQHKEKGDSLSTGEMRWIDIERKQSGIQGRKDLHPKQQEDQEGNFERKSQPSECGTSRTT